ncbi:MAG: alpha/beta fold hydrolase [Elusimicrobia bacterium]|nr:alpha/beta fold hydrolase [Elusimicrobiota bacterium]
MKRFFLVVLCLGGAWSARGADPFDVAVNSPRLDDPLILQGDYTAPSGPGAPVLIMLHGLGSHRGEWAPLIQRTTPRGWGTLAYDLRGHGQSRRTIAGQTIHFEEPENGRDAAFWKYLPKDLEQVVAALEKKTGTERAKIVLIGASLGANTVLDAGTHLKGLKALVLLSPGLDYAGILTEEPMKNLTTPTLMIAAQPDLYAFTSCQRLKTLAPPGLLTWTPLAQGTPQGAHGVQLFNGKLEEKILDWIAGVTKR